MSWHSLWCLDEQFLDIQKQYGVDNSSLEYFRAQTQHSHRVHSDTSFAAISKALEKLAALAHCPAFLS